MDPLIWLRAKHEEVVEFDGRSPIEIPNTNRLTLARWFYLWGFTRGAEIGVERGLYSEELCKANPDLYLYCVDLWAPYRSYRDHVDRQKLQRFYEQTAERLKPYKHVSLIRKFSVDAAKDFQDGSLDFVYLDGNHGFPHVVADLAAWSPKVRPGGIIAGHDYALHAWPNQIHVVQAVKGWTSAYDIRPWFVLGRTEKREGELRDDARSWFWVNEPRPVPKEGRRIKQ